MQLLKKLNFHGVNVALISLLVLSLLFSKFAISVVQILLICSWILEGNYRQKFQKIKNDKTLLIFLLYFVITIFGLIYTTDFDFGFNDVKLKLPLLILPLIISSITFKPGDKKVILIVFITAVLIKTLIDTYIIADNQFSDLRNMSFNLSHIRYSLMINLAFFSTLYLISSEIRLSKIQKIFSFILLLWFPVFMFIMQSLTGLVIFLIINYILIIIKTRKLNSGWLKKLLAITIFVLPFSICGYLTYTIYDFYDFEEVSFSELEKYTTNGNKYSHDTVNLQIENKNYIWLYICQKELRKEWNKVSKLNYDSTDNKGNELKFTLIRYLNSKGLRKDSTGFSYLKTEDLKNIENGVANYRDTNELNISHKIYKIIWQIDTYYKSGDPSGFSVAQRLEYLNTGWKIFIRHPLFGVGTGDIKKEYKNQYNTDKAKIREEFRKLSHNQYLTNLITLGIVGFIITMLSLFYPFFKNKKYKETLPFVFFIILILSMINEDTLQSQIGITFSTIFYCLFILSDSFFVKTIENNNTDGFNSKTE